MRQMLTSSRAIAIATVMATAWGVVCSCANPTSWRLNGAFGELLVNSDRNQVCGSTDIAPLIPDCPVPSACFTSACEAHNRCYARCGPTRSECDLQFYLDMIEICGQSLSIDDPDHLVCTQIAVIYWSAVRLLGQGAFDAEQDRSDCHLLDMLEEPGVCCLPGSPPICDDSGTMADCPDTAIFILGFDCAQVDETFGGCPQAPNDDCENRQVVCAGQTLDTDLGRCAAEPSAGPIGQLCSISAQDCPYGGPCLPLDQEAYRCAVGGHNLLATSNGPPAGGVCAESGEDSFQADLWYEYVAPCSGAMVIRMCEYTDYDSMLAVFGSHDFGAECLCPSDNEELLACDDDFCASSGAPSAVRIEDVIEGACYTIRVGGWSESGTDVDASRGTFQLDVGMFCAGSD